MKRLTETIRAAHTGKKALGLVFCLFVFVYDTNKQTEMLA